ncbi:unnamed protein product [Calypogeia fissa]
MKVNTMKLNTMSPTILSILFWCVALASSSPIPTLTTKLDPVRTVYQFPNNTYVENLAVRSNGQILVSIITSPLLYLFNSVQIGPPTLIHNFSASALGVAGIAEYQPDIFAVITGNFSFATSSFGPGSWAVWSVDLTGVKSQPDNTLYPPPRIRKIADIPEASSLNGMTLLSQEKGTLLVGDLVGGNIVKLTVETGDYEVVINNTFTATGNIPAGGVDGLRVRDGFVYVANFGKFLFAKIPIDGDGMPTGNGTLIAHTLAPGDQFDDFTFDRHGNAYVVTGGGNSVERISPDGSRQVIIAGSVNSTAIAEPTSAAFGRGEFDKHVLYVTTGGGLAFHSPGNPIVGGQLVAITTDAEGVDPLW